MRQPPTGPSQQLEARQHTITVQVPGVADAPNRPPAAPAVEVAAAGALAPKMDPEAGVAPNAVVPPAPKPVDGAAEKPKEDELPAGALTVALPKLNMAAVKHKRYR